MSDDRYLSNLIKYKMRSLSSLIPMHLEQDDITLETHLIIRRREIGDRALSRRRIYLDQRFWIECRDAELNPANSCSSKREIWHQLKLAVDSGRIWCPAYASVYSETMKQNPSRRVDTARIIDRLSGGIAIRHSGQRSMIEFSHWVWTSLLGDQTLGPLHQYVWTSTGSILGEAIPLETGFGSRVDRAIQKSWVDLQHTLSLEECFTIYFEQGVPASLDDDSAFQLYKTLMSKRTKSVHNTFEYVFEAELRGMLDVISDNVILFAQDLVKQGKFVSLGDNCDDMSVSELAANLNAIAHSGLRLGRVTTGLPYLHISASIHALVRRIGQPYQKGDTHDFQHAASALPYCEAFFTEKKLANLLRRDPVYLDKIYGCAVLNNRDEIVNYLEEINNA